MTFGPAEVDSRKEFEQFLVENPDIRFVDGITIDICGTLRGKRYPCCDLPKLYEQGLALPYTVYLMNVTGDSCDPCGRGFTDGDPDGTCISLPGTLVRVPWADQPRAQVLMSMTDSQGMPSMIDPRNVAAHVLKKFDSLGLRPTVAFELEFYLLDKERDPNGRPQLAISSLTGKRETSTQVYGITELDGYSAFFADVEAAGKVQKVPTSVITSEFSPGQYEINLRHVDDALMAADHCALLRNLVQRVAMRHGMEVTFMAKPFLDLSGNGMHVHMSLLDEHGHNVFDDGSEIGSELLSHAVGGMMDTMSQAMAIFSPHANAFRRFAPNLYVPVTRSWGVNNRSVAFRIPTGEGNSRRFEHRMASADANPYLVLASVLAGVHHGITNKIQPNEPTNENASDNVDPTLPMSWESALECTQSSELMIDYFTKECVDLYCETKRGEMKALMDYVSPREYEWYL